MSRLLRFISFTLLIMGLALPVYPQDAEENREPDISFGTTFVFFLGALPNTFGTAKIPLDYRQVLSHPDDDWLYGNERVLRTIPFDSLDLVSMVDMGLSFGPEIKLYRLRLKSGLSWSYPLAPSVAWGTKTINEVNQYGTSSTGTGTTLVYYGIEATGTIKPGWYAESSIRVIKNFSVVSGYGVERYGMSLVNGWDRWGKLQSNNHYDLSHNNIQKLYLGISWWPSPEDNDIGDIFIISGRTKTRVYPTKDGLSVPIDYDDKWFIAAGSSIHFTFKKK